MAIFNESVLFYLFSGDSPSSNAVRIQVVVYMKNLKYEIICVKQDGLEVKLYHC